MIMPNLCQRSVRAAIQLCRQYLARHNASADNCSSLERSNIKLKHMPIRAQSYTRCYIVLGVERFSYAQVLNGTFLKTMVFSHPKTLEVDLFFGRLQGA